MVIDEMQDYTPVQYQVISTLFPSKMTILGDRNQSVNPWSSSSAEAIRDVLPDSECVYMQKSYRSTLEITQVAQTILHNPDLIPIERRGDEPQVLRFSARQQELDYVIDWSGGLSDRGHNSLGIIIATAYLAKGLEFDEIIVPFCTEEETSSAIDRHMLYVAVTRAMHLLTITHTGKRSPFLAAHHSFRQDGDYQ